MFCSRGWLMVVFLTLRKNSMRKFLLAAAMVMVSTAAMAEKTTQYCVAYAYGQKSRGLPDVGAWFSVTKDRGDDHCDMKCGNEWTQYLKSEYKEWFAFRYGVMGPYMTRSEAESVFRDKKAYALNQDNGFDHAHHFRCSGE